MSVAQPNMLLLHFNFKGEFYPYMVRKGMQHFPFRKAVQFFWKGIGMQYQSGKVERNGKGKEIES